MKILKNLKKFEHLVWFALICLTGNVTDVILNQHPIVWARASWGPIKQLCKDVQGPAFQKAIREQTERIKEFEDRLIVKKSKKYAPDEEEEARIGFKLDQERLTSEEEQLSNAEELNDRCEMMEVGFEELFKRRCREYNQSNYFYVFLSIAGCFWCLTFLHSNPKPNYETITSMKFASATFCAIIVAAGNFWKFVKVIVFWVEAGDDLTTKDVSYKGQYGFHPAPDKIIVNCKLDYIRFNACIHGVTSISSLFIVASFMYLLFRKAKKHSDNLDLEKAPQHSRKEDLENREHQMKVKKIEKAGKIPKAGEKIDKKNEENKNNTGWQERNSNGNNESNESKW